VPNVESFFFPLDVRLRLGTEGYSPRLVEKAVRQASKAPSFAEASADLWELAEVEISATHVQRLGQRIGEEWIELRDAEVARFQKDELPRDYQNAPAAAAVMLDGGRLQTRAADSGRGVSDPGWQEVKVACCLSLASKAQGSDPQPEPPAKFLEPTEAARLAMEVKSRSKPALGRKPAVAEPKKTKKRRKRKRKRRIEQRVRTVVATMEDSETFGWQMVAEVHRRGLDQAKRKACVCDGQRYNWTLFEMHLLPLGFIGILDFLHLLGYLYDAAHALYGPHQLAAGWKCYQRWLRWAWSGEIATLIRSLRAAVAKLSELPEHAGLEDRRRSVAETLGYVLNNRERMDYPEYRRLGLPISSAAVESTIKQINRRTKSTEKFWLQGGAEAILQLRAAYLSQDGRWEKRWSQQRKHRRAAGTGRLAQAA
jgi:hypothetical protein